MGNATWYIGTVVQWCIGTLVHWCIGTVVQWYSGTVVHWYMGTVAQWYSGTVVHWYTGTLVHWYIKARCTVVGVTAQQCRRMYRTRIACVAGDVNVLYTHLLCSTEGDCTVHTAITNTVADCAVV